MTEYATQQFERQFDGEGWGCLAVVDVCIVG